MLLTRSVREARRALAAVPEQTGAAARRTMERLDILIGQATTVIDQIAKRVRDEPITDRLVSFADPDARPVRKNKIATPAQFGYVSQLTGSTRRGSRGLILPPVTCPGSVIQIGCSCEHKVDCHRSCRRPRAAPLSSWNSDPDRRSTR